MGLVFLVSLMIGRVDPITLLTLAVVMYLTLVELREFRPRPHWKWWMWWLSLAFLTHFVGYLVLRGYAAYRRSHEARA